MSELQTIKNLIVYWRAFGSSELPKRPSGIQMIIKDTIQALEDHKALLEGISKKEEGK